MIKEVQVKNMACLSRILGKKRTIMAYDKP